jgi:hypothetical protein
MALRLSIKYILFRIGKYYHSMMPLFRQGRCAPWASIWCHADFTSHERQHHLAKYDKDFTNHTDVYVSARVAISNVNILPEVGLYNGAIGIVVKILYQHKPEGPNDKEHTHDLPGYMVVIFQT